MKHGYYFITPEATPYFNMAFDSWLFDRMSSGHTEISAFLRLYTWQSPAVTYGYNQKLRSILDRARLPGNIPVIKRITGGRAIYHDLSEITFSLIADLGVFPVKKRSLARVNQLISEAVVDLLGQTGLSSNWAKSSAGDFRSESTATKRACFSSHSRYEILIGRYKIAAGAQRRSGNHFIHQGSLKVNGIAACPAIGQKRVDLKGRTRANGEPLKKYNIDDFRLIFGKIFSEKLRIAFTESVLPRDWLENEEKILTNFMQSSLEGQANLIEQTPLQKSH